MFFVQSVGHKIFILFSTAKALFFGTAAWLKPKLCYLKYWYYVLLSGDSQIEIDCSFNLEI